MPIPHYEEVRRARIAERVIVFFAMCVGLVGFGAVLGALFYMVYASL